MLASIDDRRSEEKEEEAIIGASLTGFWGLSSAERLPAFIAKQLSVKDYRLSIAKLLSVKDCRLS